MWGIECSIHWNDKIIKLDNKNILISDSKKECSLLLEEIKKSNKYLDELLENQWLITGIDLIWLAWVLKRWALKPFIKNLKKNIKRRKKNNKYEYWKESSYGFLIYHSDVSPKDWEKENNFKLISKLTSNSLFDNFWPDFNKAEAIIENLKNSVDSIQDKYNSSWWKNFCF